MTDKPRTRMRIPVLLACSAFLAWPAVLSAQEEIEVHQEDVVRLTEFRVATEADEGYRATNTISGTRLDTPIRDVPMPIEVITEDFIDDIGAISMREALAFSSGVLLDSTIGGFGDPGGSPSFDFSPSGFGQGMGDDQIKMRGFTTNTQLRGGFEIGGALDTANISRLEVVRGPAALLYGVNILGGVVNVLPKRPLETARYELRHTIGSHDMSRTTFDATGPLFAMMDHPLTERPVNYRLIGAYQEVGEMRDFQTTRDLFIAPSLEFQPFETTNVFLDFEYRERKMSGTGPTELGLGFLPNNEFNEQHQWIRDLSDQDHRRWNYGGPDPFETDDRWNLLLEVEQFITDDLTLFAGYNTGKIENRGLSLNAGIQTLSSEAADTIGVPFNARTPIPGTDNIRTVSHDWADMRQDQWNEQTRFDLNYNFELFDNRQNILIGRLDKKTHTKTHQFDRSDQAFKAFTDFSPIRYPGEHVSPINRDTSTEEWNTGHYAVLQLRFLDERLQLIGGNRWDRFHVRDVRWNWENGQRVFDESHANQGPDFGTPQQAPVRDGFRFDGEPSTHTTPTFGVNYRVTDAVTVYGLTAGGIFPNPGQRGGDGQIIDNEEVESMEAGVKFDFLEGRISGTVSAFRIDRENAVWFYSFAPAPRWNDTAPGRFSTELPISYWVRAEDVPDGYVPHEGVPIPYRSELPPHFNQPGDELFTLLYDELDENVMPDGRTYRDALEARWAAEPDYFPVGGNTNNPSLSRGSDVTFGDKSRGVDAQMIFSLLDNWQLTVNYAYVKRTVNQGFQFVDFEDLATGEQFGTEYDVWVTTGRTGGRESFEDPLRPSTFDGGIMIGQQLDDSPRHSWSFWNNYTFDEGVLAGLSLRLGGIFTGERMTTPEIGGGNVAVNPFPRPWTERDLEWRGGLAYGREVGDFLLRFNLTVNNLLDRQKSERIATFDDNGETVQRRTVQFFEPRSFRLTASLAF